MARNDVTQRDGFVLFWSGWPSNWYPCQFIVNAIPYNCGEQWMMAEKARTFGDDEMLTAILEAGDPATQKALGRQVRNYDDARWKEISRDRVYIGLLEKFRQNPDLNAKLLDTGNNVIVEASPVDKLWGIGLATDDPRATNPKLWQGKNWLGQVLTRVRDTLRTQKS